MTENERIEIILQQQRSIINRILKRLKNSEEKITTEDLREIFWYRFHPFYDEYLVDKLDEINNRLKDATAEKVARLRVITDKLDGINNRLEYEVARLRVITDKLDEINNRLKDTNFQCRYTEENDVIMKMMVAPRQGQTDIKEIRNTGLKEIRDFTKDIKELIIIDPYIFGGETNMASTYIEEFKRCSRINNQSINKIHIIYSSAHGNTTAIKNGIKKLASDNNCTLTNYDSDKIHDRIWIKDKKEAIVVGTSFGGIGNRLCFILELPQYDLISLLDHLTKEKFFATTFS